MKLFYSQTSPYARKVRVVARELGLADRVTEIEVNPFADDSPLPAINPLAKVPTLIAGDGEVLFDSPVICEYLDEISGRRSMLGSGAVRWETLRLAAMADGLMDATVAIRLESLRPADRQHAPWIDRQLAAVRRTLEVVAGTNISLAASPTIGQVALACALGYLDLRLASEDWRAANPTLAKWYAEISARPSMVESAPLDPSI